MIVNCAIVKDLASYLVTQVTSNLVLKVNYMIPCIEPLLNPTCTRRISVIYNLDSASGDNKDILLVVGSNYNIVSCNITKLGTSFSTEMNSQHFLQSTLRLTQLLGFTTV